MTRSLFTLTTLTLALPAAAADVDTIVRGVEQRYAEVGSIQAAFTQTTSSEFFGATDQRGTLVLSRPSSMRWTFADGKQFITDGSTMWIHNPAEKQVLRYGDLSTAGSGADALLQSLDRVSEVFTVELLESTDEVLRLGLEPKQKQDQVKQIELTLTPAYDLRQLVVVDAFDGRTQLAFEEVKLGEALAADAFAYTPPPGFEVIRAN